MKNTKSFLLVLLSAAILFAGCKASLLEKDSGNKGPMATVTFNLQSGTQSARTAVPGTINWAEYTYTLKVSDGKTSTEPLTNETYANLAAAKLTLALGVYTFTLDAYSGSVKVLSGTINNLDISGGAVSLTFVMKQEPGLESAVSVKLWLPSYNGSSIVKKVMAGVSKSPVATIGECTLKGARELIISGDKTATPSVTFGANDLQTGKRQYVMFYLYDENEDLIGTITEGVVLLYGKTSSSEIGVDQYTLNTYPVEIKLFRDGGAWDNVRNVTLRSKVDLKTEYELKRLGTGSNEDPFIFIGNVPNSAYYVLVQQNIVGQASTFRNTYVSIDTAESSVKSLYYYTVTLEPGTGINLVSVTDVTPQPDGAILFLNGDKYKYKAELKPGYNQISSINVTENGITKSLALNTENEIQITKKTTISSANATATVYNITYDISNVTVGDSVVQPKWVSGNKDATVAANVPAQFKTYTVTNTFVLPTAADLSCTYRMLDGWYIQGQSESSAFAQINKDTLHQNLTLVPKWKKMEASIGPSSAGETSNGTVYSNGISLIIQAGETDGVTNLYYDINANGIKDGDDALVEIESNGSVVTNFTNYEISASSMEGNVASNVTFTVTGGNIYSIRGLGKNAENESKLNIFGSPTIGDYSTITTVIDEENNEYKYSNNVNGVILSSFTGEIVTVTNNLTSGKVVLLTDHEYDYENPTHVVKIADTSGDYVSTVSIFECFNTVKTVNGYSRKNLTKKSIDTAKTDWRITLNPDVGGISLKSNTGMIAADADGATGFTLGENRITTDCSVFSISCTDGYMKFKQNKIYSNAADAGKENGLTYLAQKQDLSYQSALDTTNKFVYMHVMASNNQFTDIDASDFLSQVVFIPDNKEMKIKINLETVPFKQIQTMMGNKTKTLEGVEFSGSTNNGFSYFDGSFYLGVKTNKKIDWISAYNDSKKLSFNGMKGYLINITSTIENEYIYNQMSLGQAWTGGARYDTAADHNDGSFTCLLNEDYHVEYDSDSRTSPGLKFRIDSPHYRWQAGPEAGQIFTTGSIPDTNTTNTSVAGEYYYSGTQEKPYSGTSISNGYFRVRSTTDVRPSIAGKNVVFFDSSLKKIGTGTLAATVTSKSGTYRYTITNATGSGTISYAVPADECVTVTRSNKTRTGDGVYKPAATQPGYANWGTGEPNDSNGGQSEECVHFLSTGLWNDYSWNYVGSQSTDGVFGYIVEFTPYQHKQGDNVIKEVKADAMPIHAEGSFNLDYVENN